MNQELREKLETIAIKRTIPFCYSCYKDAPTGKCETCGSDDLMRHLPSSGVEYGTDWVIKDILSSELNTVDLDSEFEESVRQCYPESITIGWLKDYDLVSALKELDPISWELAKSEWIDSEVSDDRMVSLDHGSTYYWSHDLESLE